MTPLKLLSTDYVLQSKICPRLSLKASRAENGFYLYFRREIASDSKSNGKTTRNLRSFAISFLRCVWFMCSLKLQQKMRVGKDLLASFSILFSQGGSCSAWLPFRFFLYDFRWTPDWNMTPDFAFSSIPLSRGYAPNSRLTVSSDASR